MLIQILSHVPAWVAGIFALLLWLGIKQSLPTSPSLKHVSAIALATAGISIGGTLSTFGAAPAVLLAWVGAALAAGFVVMQRAMPYGTVYDVSTRRFALPGSWVPLIVMMGIFGTKFALGATLALHPDLLRNAVFSSVVAALCGGFSGVLAGRAGRLACLAQGWCPSCASAYMQRGTLTSPLTPAQSKS